MTKIDKFKLIAAVGLCLTAGFIGGFFTAPAIPLWYNQLQKPEFNPPSWVFSPVWTILYILMGVSLYIIWNSRINQKEASRAYFAFGLQLGLNILWSILFFGLRNLFYAFVDIILLLAAIVATIAVFYRIDRKAALLLVPYLLWVSFASVLNYSIWQLNLLG